jgi:4-diphosphocytidyl-2-C-methyl-D-erythritol kinase
MIRFPNAKINLGLYITNRRPDGYHDLETVFYPVNLTDSLEIIPAHQTAAFYPSGLHVAGNMDNNLVWKAYSLLKEKYPEKVGELDVYLLKAIPMGAGMGGGSADGACMLQMVNDFYAVGLSKEELATMALQLGSDCPFFIYNTPQFATGRGEQLQPVEIDLSGFSIQLICPQVHISTAEAFRMITPKPSPFDLRGLGNINVVDWKDKVGNDFEGPIFDAHPELLSIKQQLYTNGAVYAAMSGSGSTIYGLMPKRLKASINTSLQTQIFYLE